MKRFDEFISEDLNLALTEPTSQASEQAKQLGLIYVGFGRYENPTTRQITHVVKNDRLIPFSRAIKTNSYKVQSQNEIGSFTDTLKPQEEELHDALVEYYDPTIFNDEE